MSYVDAVSVSWGWRSGPAKLISTQIADCLGLSVSSARNDVRIPVCVRLGHVIHHTRSTRRNRARSQGLGRHLLPRRISISPERAPCRVGLDRVLCALFGARHAVQSTAQMGLQQLVADSSAMAKSCTRTGCGCPLGRNSRPPFLKSPTSSFFFVSTEITGCPAAWNAFTVALTCSN